LILFWLGKAIAEFDGQLLFPRAMDLMEKEVSTLTSAWMGMQKLATTPFPFPYIQLAVSLLYIYMYTVAFTIAIQYRYVGILPSGLLGFALHGLYTIGCELEDPFGEEANDLDLDFFVAGANAGAKAFLPKSLTPLELEPTGASPLSLATQRDLKAMARGPVSPGGVSVEMTAVASPSGEVPADSEQNKRELRACADLQGLGPGLQGMFRHYFERWLYPPSLSRPPPRDHSHPFAPLPRPPFLTRRDSTRCCCCGQVRRVPEWPD